MEHILALIGLILGIYLIFFVGTLFAIIGGVVALCFPLLIWGANLFEVLD